MALSLRINAWKRQDPPDQVGQASLSTGWPIWSRKLWIEGEWSWAINQGRKLVGKDLRVVLTRDTLKPTKQGWRGSTPRVCTQVRKSLQDSMMGEVLIPFLGNQDTWVPIWSATTLTHLAWRMNRRNEKSVCSCCRDTTSLGSQRHFSIAYTNGVLQSMCRGSLARPSQDGKDRVSFMWESSGNARSCAWGWVMRLLIVYGSGLESIPMREILRWVSAEWSRSRWSLF